MGVQAEEVERVLESVGFGTDMRQKPIASLSGGWKMKLALGTALCLLLSWLIPDTQLRWSACLPSHKGSARGHCCCMCKLESTLGLKLMDGLGYSGYRVSSCARSWNSNTVRLNLWVCSASDADEGGHLPAG